MSDTSLHVRDSLAADAAPNRTARRITAVLLFAAATAIGARISVPMTPVPVTLQTLFVLLSGALLGARLGATSQLAYLAAGIIGLPVFTAGAGLGYLLGPTGGYLLTFPITAYLAGVVADRTRGGTIRSGLLMFVGLFLASLVTLAGGAAWLGVVTGDLGSAIAVGFLPFLLGDLLKVALATLIAWRGRGRTLGWL